MHLLERALSYEKKGGNNIELDLEGIMNDHKHSHSHEHNDSLSNFDESSPGTKMDQKLKSNQSKKDKKKD